MQHCFISVYQRNAARQANVTKYWNLQLSHNNMITMILISKGRKYVLTNAFVWFWREKFSKWFFFIPSSEEKQTKHKCRRCIRKQCYNAWRVLNKVSTSETRFKPKGIIWGNNSRFKKGQILTSKFLPQLRWKWKWHYGDFSAGESKESGTSKINCFSRFWHRSLQRMNHPCPGSKRSK